MALADIQTSFAGGELSPQLYGRTDLDKFQIGAALLRNFFADYRGGATNRPGTKFIADVTANGWPQRLLPFIVSTEASYVLVFSNLLVSIYNDGVFVTSVVTPYLAADLALLKYAQSADVLTLVHPSYAPANLTRTSDTTFAYAPIAVGPTIQPPVITAMVRPHNGPYNFGYLVTAVDLDGKEESLPSNPAVQSSEAMNETTNRVMGISWTAPAQPVSAYNIYKWGPIDSVTMNPATVWGFIGTSATTTFTDNNIAPDYSKQPPGWGDPFSGGQIQSIVVATGGSGYNGVSGGWPSAIPYVPLSISGDGTGAAGYAVIDHAAGTIIGAYLTNPGKNYTTATVTANGQGGTGATFTLQFAPPAPIFPACTAYLQQRRCFGGADLKPETLVLSNVGRYDNFNTTPISLATDAIVISLASQEVNTIKALVPVSYGMLAFTTGGSFLLNGGAPYASITPSTITAQPQVSSGANDLPPLNVNANILYGQNKGNRVRNLSFAWQKQSYTGSDLSTLAAHLFDDHKTLEWTWAEEPFKLVWAVRDDGKMLSLTYVPDQEVFAWARHDTQGFFRSVCSVPEGDVNAVYVIVERFVPSAGDTNVCDGWFYHLERVDNRLTDCLEQAWFLDDAVRMPLNVGDGEISLSAPSGDAILSFCKRELAGITTDGLACLSIPAFACDPAASSMTIAFWTKTSRVLGPSGASFGEILNWVDMGGMPIGSQIQISSQGQLSHSSGSPGRVDWANDAVTNFRVAVVPWPGAAYIQGFLADDSTPNDDLWMFQLMSFDITPRATDDWLTGYINGVSTIGQFSDPAPQQVVGANTTLNINGLTLSIGGTLVPTDMDGFVGEVMNVWAAVGVDLREIDGSFSDATIAKFMGPGNTPLYLGDRGELVTGTPADLYCSRYTDEPVSVFYANKGTGGGPFTVYGGRGGVVRASSTPNPSGEPRPVPLACSVTGGLAVGDTLTVHANFTFTPTTTAYQWQNGQTNEGTDVPTFVNEVGDVGFTTTCVMTVTNASGSFVSASKFVGPITA